MRKEIRSLILAEKIVSSLDVPGFSRASMDGFAVLAEDTLAAREDWPVCLRLVGSVPMGVLARRQVAQGEAAKIEIKAGTTRPFLYELFPWPRQWWPWCWPITGLRQRAARLIAEFKILKRPPSSPGCKDKDNLSGLSSVLPGRTPAAGWTAAVFGLLSI
jgi:hypothetical protein